MHTYTIAPKIKNQSGLSIVTAIFLVVVLALMASGMVSLLATSQQSISQEISAAKAYMAGRSCLQWGMYQSVYTGTTGTHNVTFNNTSSGLYNTACNITLSNITTDGLIFYNINTIATFSNTASPEFSQREMRLQFQP